MKKIIISDVTITWDDNKTIKDICDLILILTYGDLNKISTDKENIQRRQKRLKRKLERQCKTCGEKLNSTDNIRCEDCKQEERKRYIKKAEQHMKEYHNKCNEKEKACLHYLLCQNCDKYKKENKMDF